MKVPRLHQQYLRSSDLLEAIVLIGHAAAVRTDTPPDTLPGGRVLFGIVYITHKWTWSLLDILTINTKVCGRKMMPSSGSAPRNTFMTVQYVL
jgi:hypothetical protein